MLHLKENYSDRDILVSTAAIWWEISRNFTLFTLSIKTVREYHFTGYRAIMTCNTEAVPLRLPLNAMKRRSTRPLFIQIGSVHYIVLNNVFYLGRDYFYMGYIMFIWLEQDLAHVPEGSALFVAMHIPGRLDEEVKPFSTIHAP